MKRTLIALLLISSVLLTGCSSSITAISLKGERNKNKKAIPYYLPQPYLLITRDYSHLGTKTTKTEETMSADKQKPDEKPSGAAKKKTSTTTEPVSITVNGFTYKIIYLPNLAEKYGLVYNSGNGESDLSFTLKDGWMFTGLKLESDAQIDETITAMGSLVGSIAEVAAKLPGLLDARISKDIPPKPDPAIWLFKMTFDDKVITFDPVTLDFKK